jgi:hypothetical protein
MILFERGIILLTNVAILGLFPIKLHRYYVILAFNSPHIGNHPNVYQQYGR